MKSMRAIMMILLLLAISCKVRTENENGSSTVSLTNTPEGASIEKLLKNYYADMSARKWENYQSHFWPGATITTSWAQPGDSTVSVDVTTITDFIKETRLGPDSQPIFEEKMKNSNIHVQNNLATAWVEYEARFGKPDSVMEWSGVDLFSLLRHNGEWKIVSLAFESK
jgi:hypothetical protein